MTSMSIEIVHDQHRPRALSSRGGSKRVRQHERRRHGDRDVAAAQPRQQRAEHPGRENEFGQRAPDQRTLAGHPVPDLDHVRFASRSRRSRSRRPRQYQDIGFPRRMFRNGGHDRRRRILIRRIMLADDDDFSGLLHHDFRARPLPGKRDQAAFDPNSGTASFSTARIVDRSSPAIASSSAESHLRSVCIGGSFGLAAMMPATPISTVGLAGEQDLVQPLAAACR